MYQPKGAKLTGRAAYCDAVGRLPCDILIFARQSCVMSPHKPCVILKVWLVSWSLAHFMTAFLEELHYVLYDIYNIHRYQYPKIPYDGWFLAELHFEPKNLPKTKLQTSIQVLDWSPSFLMFWWLNKSSILFSWTILLDLANSSDVRKASDQYMIYILMYFKNKA